MRICIFFIFIYIVSASGFSQTNTLYNPEYSELKGPYLGQKPPTQKAELFVPGIVSTNEKEALYGVFNEGRYIIFDRTPQGFTDYENYPVYIYQEINGNWIGPTLTQNLGKPWYFDHPAPNNIKEVFYTWWLPLDKNGNISTIDLWRVKFNNSQWEEPEKLPFPVNTKNVEAWPSVSQNGILYFFSKREGGVGGADIYRSIPENEEYKSIENLGNIVNSPGLDHDPCISADGSMLIFSSNREESLGKDDLYVTFQTENGTWTNPVNLGNNINSTASDNRPYLTPCEKYLFFTSTRNGNLDIFWVSTEVVLKLKGDKLITKGNK